MQMLKCRKVAIISIAISLIGIFWAQVSLAAIVNFSDANLEAGVRSELNKPTGDIYDVDMESLKTLRIHDLSISTLQGLEYATNLSTLELTNNGIGDISLLSELTNLESLLLDGNNIVDVSPLSGLTNLERLLLNNNNIADVSPLSGLAKLWNLELMNNQIEVMDFSNSNFTLLSYFYITGNPLTEALFGDATFNVYNFYSMVCGQSMLMGIGSVDGVLTLDMSGVDFGEVLYFQEMHDLDDIENVLLVNATNLEGSEVVTLTEELDSLNFLDVTGLWESFDTVEQNSLYAWDAIDGNTLITAAVPEPATLSMLLILVTLAIFQRKRK